MRGGWTKGQREFAMPNSGIAGTCSKINLSFVCRQTHAETALLPYTLGLFDIRTTELMGYGALERLKSFLGRRSPRQIEAIAALKFTRYSITLRRYWHRTRTAVYWVAKIEDLSASFGGMSSIEALMFDVSSIGPSD